MVTKLSNYIIIIAGFGYADTNLYIPGYDYDSTIIEKTDAGFVFKKDMDIQVTVTGKQWGGNAGSAYVYINNIHKFGGGRGQSTTTPANGTASVSAGDVLSVSGSGYSSHVYPCCITVAVAE